MTWFWICKTTWSWWRSTACSLRFFIVTDVEVVAAVVLIDRGGGVEEREGGRVGGKGQSVRSG